MRIGGLERAEVVGLAYLNILEMHFFPARRSLNSLATNSWMLMDGARWALTA
jgi:hypothetical protein